MTTNFCKMHGIGNDYLFFDCFHKAMENPGKVSEKLSKRRFSVGGDGIILAEKSEIADAKMRIFNADGSEGKMCGNGLRCFAKYLYEVKKIKKKSFLIETLSGLREVFFKTDETGVREVTAEMGAPRFSPSEIPMNAEGERIIDYPLATKGGDYLVSCLSMGNPHCVVFCDEIDSLDLVRIGPRFERNPAFPEGVNTEFVRILSPTRLEMRVYERGSGETYACGTGACAAAVAAIERGACRMNSDITVVLRGGSLKVRQTEETVFLTGPAEISFFGTVEI